MNFKTEVYDYEISQIFSQFSQLIGEKNWRHRVQLLNSETRGNVLLKDFHHDEYALAYMFDKCSEYQNQYGKLHLSETDLSNLYPAIAFASHSLSIIDSLSQANKQSFIRRIAAAFRNPEDIRALTLEFTVAHHFATMGYSLAWPEQSGQGTYDLLVEDIGSNGLEIECKSISDDKGRRIKKRESLDFFRLMLPDLKSSLKGLKSGLSIVVKLPGKLPTAFKDRKNLATNIYRSILSNSNIITNEFDLSIKAFDINLIHNLNPSNQRKTIDSISETLNQYSIIVGTFSGGAICFTIQSLLDDTLFESLNLTCRRAAENQLTGTKPGLVLVEFSGISPQEMINLANHDKTKNDATSLRKWANAFLNEKQNRNHIIGIGFLSKGQIKNHDPVTVVSNGSTYMFAKKESPMWDESFSRLFEQ